MVSLKTFKRMCRAWFAPGKSNMIIGGRGSGKTTLCMWFVANWLIPEGYFILSNIVCKRRTGTDEDGYPTFVESYPPRYTKIQSFAELMAQVGQILTNFREPNICWIIDEGAVGFSAYMSVFAKQQRTLIEFLTLARKFRMSTLMVSVASKLVHSKLRDSDEGFLAALFRKDDIAINKWVEAEDSEGKDIRRFFILEWAEKMLDENDILVFDVGDITNVDFVKPEKHASVGDIVFDSAASATFGLGKFPGTDTPFNFEHLLAYISGCISEEVGPRIIKYFEASGEVEVQEVDMPISESDVRKGDPGWKARVAIPRVKEEVVNILGEHLTTQEILDELSAGFNGSEMARKVYRGLVGKYGEKETAKEKTLRTDYMPRLVEWFKKELEAEEGR